jgi:AbrB family looped-hinge helix DNA binding protein
MPSATLTSKGQITVPRQIRERLGLEQGDVLDFEVLPGGELRVSARRPRASIFGLLKEYARGGPVSVGEMRQAIERHHRSEEERIRRGG